MLHNNKAIKNNILYHLRTHKGQIAKKNSNVLITKSLILPIPGGRLSMSRTNFMRISGFWPI
jgi:hypothetical protein